jgi:hypothetical protein
LKSIAGTATLLGTTGVAQAQSAEEEKVGAQGNTVDLTEKTALSASEVKAEIQRLSDKYGSDSVQNIVPGHIDPLTGEFQEDVTLSTSGSGPDSTQNLNYLTSWNDDYKVYGGTPERLLLTTDHFISVYKSNETDSQGRYHYFYWMWSQTETNNDYWHAETHLKFMRNALNIRSTEEEVTNFSPTTTSDINGRQKEIGASVGYGGATFGINGTVYVKDATFGPETGEVDKGPAGEFSATLDANGTQGRQALNATVVTRHERDRSGFYDCKWRTYCEGRQ